MSLKVLRKGMNCEEVGHWQSFLIGTGHYFGRVDDDFGDMTEDATMRFQRKYKLDADGVVGKATYGKAIMLGFDIDLVDADNDYYPPKPDFQPLYGNEARMKIFGHFDYVATPTKKNPEKIKVLGDWKEKHIVKVIHPAFTEALQGKYSTIYWHKAVEHQLRGFLDAIYKEGLHKRIISYSGSYYPRFIRGSRKTLSNHSWGTAFDINAPQNWLGRQPAKIGEKGCVLELVPIANEFGFYFGGHFRRKDGMHFEIAKILD
jgi:hypothetical protein